MKFIIPFVFNTKVRSTSRGVYFGGANGDSGYYWYFRGYFRAGPWTAIRQKATRSAARVEAKALMEAFRSCIAVEDDIEDCAEPTIGGALRGYTTTTGSSTGDNKKSKKGVQCLKVSEINEVKKGTEDRCYF